MQVLILAGGTGTRLWPLSRAKAPKQFQRLVGKKTLFQMAVARALLVAKPEDVFVATNSMFIPLVRAQAPKIPVKNILAEPAFRDTATCLAYSSARLAARAPGQVCAVLYADHLITEEKELVRKLRAASQVAMSGVIAIIEVKSQYPATELGWVQMGNRLPDVRGEEVYAFQKFCEKPPLKKAISFHRSREYLFNTGLYVWRTDVLLEKFREHLPDTYARIERMQAAQFAPKVVAVEYAACQKISIDFAVMERLSKKEVAILPADLGWSDVGTFDSLKQELSQEGENCIDATALTNDTKNCYIRAESGKVVITSGIRDMVIVDTGDALLVCKQGESAAVKKLVEQLKKTRFA